MPTFSKDEALDLLEKVRREYVLEARSAAISLFQKSGKPITIDDVRQVCPPPEDIDGRVMGAVLRPPEWVRVGYVSSSRRTCHNRPISQFAWTGGDPFVRDVDETIVARMARDPEFRATLLAEIGTEISRIND